MQSDLTRNKQKKLGGSQTQMIDELLEVYRL